MNFLPLLSVMVTLFLLMICGFFCRKRGIIDTVASKRLSSLIISVGQPMMIIGALNNAEYSEENIAIAWQVTLIGVAIHTILSLSAFLICRRTGKLDRTKIFEFSLVFGNCGFLGFPILDSIFGKGVGSFMGAFYVISFHIFLWTWGIWILGRGRADIKLTPKKIFLNYGTVPCAIGVILYFLKPILQMPDFVGDFFSYLGGLCTPISVLVTGALLATISLPKMFRSGRLYLHSAIKLLIFPILICSLAAFCGLEDRYVLLTAAMVGVPSAATITMLAELYEIEPGYASATVGMTSVLATATLPAVMLFAQWITSVT